MPPVDVNRENPEEQVYGRNAVRAALQAQRPLRRLLVGRDSRGEIVDEIVSLARASGVTVDFRPRESLDRMAGRHHQGVVALVAVREYVNFENLLDGLGSQAFLVFLDRVQDPHNLGAIIRSAHVVSADGVVIPQRGSAGLTGAVAKAASGAVDHMPVCCVRNLRESLLRAKDAGLWVTGLTPGATRSFTDIDYCGQTAIVIGGEERGMRRTVAEACDHEVGIAMGAGQVGWSFNASVAAGIVLFEVYRQRAAGSP